MTRRALLGSSTATAMALAAGSACAPREASTDFDAVFDAAGARGYVHAIDLDRDMEIRHDGDTVSPSGSMGKVPVLVTFMRAMAAGRFSLQDRVRVSPEGRTPGPTGISAMQNEVELSWWDVAALMIGISDNHATDMILGLVPPREVTGTMRELGLAQTTLDGTIADMSAHGSADSWLTTPAEMTRLLATIWRDEVTPPELCAQMRTMLQRCATHNGLVTGFPLPLQMGIGHKTGTGSGRPDGFGVTNETGVVEYPDGGRYAVTVITRTPMQTWRVKDERVFTAIGRAAKLAVDGLRGA
jgi:beta-lactamase class A